MATSYTTTFTATQSANSGDRSTSYQVASAARTAGLAIPSDAIITSAKVQITNITIYADRGFLIDGYCGWNSISVGSSQSATWNINKVASLYTGAIPILFKANYTGTANSFNIRAGCKFIFTIVWEYRYEKLSTPQVSISPNVTGKQGTAVLSWPVPVGKNIVIPKYEVYRNDGIIYEVTTNSCSVLAPDVSGNSFTYTVKAFSTPTGYESDISNIVTLNALWTSISPPSALRIGNSYGPWYYGTSGNVPITFEWNQGIDGTNNAIVQYSGSALGVPFTTPATTPSIQKAVPTLAGTYNINLIAIGQSENSSGIQQSFYVLDNSNVISFIGGPGHGASGIITYEWEDSVSAPVGGTYSYRVEWCYSATEVGTYTDWAVLATTSDKSYDFNLPASGLPFEYYYKVRVTCLLNGTQGGYTAMDPVEYSIVTCHVTPLTLPDSTVQWTTIKDVYSNSPVAIQLYCYDSVYLEWAASSSTPTSGEVAGYRVQRKVGINGTFADIGSDISVGSTLAYTDNILNYLEGVVFYYRIRVFDEYGSNQYYIEKSITKRSVPTLTATNVNIGGIPNTGVSLTVNGRNGTYADGTDDLYCDIQLSYGNIVTERYHQLFIESSNGSVVTEDLVLSIPALKTLWLPNLYTEVITNKKPMQKITLVLKIYPTWFDAGTGQSHCYKSYNYVVDMDYRGSIVTGSLNQFSIVSATPHSDSILTYLNPADLVQFNIPELSWTDADGGTSGATVSYTVTRPGAIFNYDSSGTKIPGRLEELVDEDTNITYTLSAILSYNDSALPQSLSRSAVINRARWNNDIVKIVGLDRSDTELQGTIVLPSRCFGSILYSNVKNALNIKLYEVNENNEYSDLSEITGLTWTPNTFVKSTLSYHFSLTGVAIPNNIRIIAVVVVNNTSHQQESEASPYYVRQLINRSSTITIHDEFATVAYRKGSVGINVPKGYKNPLYGSNDDPVALYVNTPSTAVASPTVRIEGEGAHGATVQFKHDNVESGLILTDIVTEEGADYARIFFKNLSHTFDYMLNVADRKPADANNPVPYYEINNKYITSTTHPVPTTQEVFLRVAVTEAEGGDNTLATQRERIRQGNAAQFVGGAQSNGSCIVLCYGTLPTINIPITVVVRGG